MCVGETSRKPHLLLPKRPLHPLPTPNGGGVPFSVISLIVTSILLYCNVPPTPDGEQLGGRDSVFYFDIASAQNGA